MLESLVAEFSLKRANPAKNPWVARAREEKQKVIGCMCNVPLELLHASGILPVRLLGRAEKLKQARAYFPTVFCNYACSLLEVGLEDWYAALDGIVAVNMCDTLVHVANAMHGVFSFSFFHFLNRPHDASLESSFEFFRHELEKLKSSLEEFTGTTITDSNLKSSITLYNENRLLLQRIYTCRGQIESPLLTALETATIAYTSQVLPPNVNRDFLKQILKKTEKRGPVAYCTGPRLHLSGSTIEDFAIFDLIEESNATVVSDDLCSGQRFFMRLVDENLPPMEALTKYYLEELLCPVMHTPGIEDKRLADIQELVFRNNVDGVIFCLQKYCDPHQLDLPYLQQQLRSAGIPTLNLEIEGEIAKEQLRTRVEAFIEVINEKGR